MALTPTDSITGPSVALNALYAIATGTATGSMVVPAGSYVWLQVAGSALGEIPTGQAAVIGVTTHCH